MTKEDDVRSIDREKTVMRRNNGEGGKGGGRIVRAIYKGGVNN